MMLASMIVVFASCNTLRLVLLSTKLMLRRPQETSGDSVGETSRGISDGDDRGSRTRMHKGAMGQRLPYTSEALFPNLEYSRTDLAQCRPDELQAADIFLGGYWALGLHLLMIVRKDRIILSRDLKEGMITQSRLIPNISVHFVHPSSFRHNFKTSF